MKIIVKIFDLYQHEIGDELFQELCRIYPEGNKINNFAATLPEDDERVRRITTELERRGYQIHSRFDFKERPSYLMLKQRIYDQDDLEAVPWLLMSPRTGRSPQVERLPGGMLKLSPTHLKPEIHIAHAAGQYIIVSDHLRKLILDEGLENVLFHPTQLGAGKASSREPIWELRSTLILPQLSPTIIFHAYTGDVYDEKVHLAREYYEGLFEVSEMHYLRSDFEQTPNFDIAETAEKLWGQKTGLLIVSQRFYRFCRDLKLDIEWVPVRIDEDEPGVVDEQRPTAQRIEIITTAPQSSEVEAPVPTLEEALTRLRDFQERFPDQFQKPCPESDIEAVSGLVGLPLPQAWKEVWKVIGGFELSDCVVGESSIDPWAFSAGEVAGKEAVPLSDYTKEVIDAQLQESKVIEGDGFVIKQRPQPKKMPGGEHASMMRALRYGTPNFPLHYLIVGGEGSGDMIALDTSAIDDSGDCPVVLISHEYNGVEHEWASVAAFLMDVLAEPGENEEEDEE